MSGRLARLAALAAVAGTCAVACSRRGTPTAAGAPIVLISIDTLRADHLPAYGYRGVETPAIDALRHDGVLFENAYSAVPLTLPSHVTLLTGLLPPAHGVRDNLGYQLDRAAHPTLPTLLKAAGYATGGAVSAYVLRGATGIGPCFDFYDDVVESPTSFDAASQVQRAGAETARRALQWVEQVKDKPFFLFLHLYEPHSPYDPPEPFKSRYGSAYDGEIATADGIVGTVLARLKERGLYDRALVVLVSDHGEGLGDHGEEFHGILLHREVLHVPLVVKLPRAERAGESVARPVSLVDVMPTIAALAGVATPKGLPGTSLLAPASQELRDRGLYAETYYPRIHLGWSELHALVGERYHYIHGPHPLLYDIVADAPERQDLLARQPGVAAGMARVIAATDSGFAGPGAVSAEDAQRLAALGYLGGAVTPGAGPLPDPAAEIHVLADVKAAFHLTATGREREAVEAFRAILKRNPRFLDVQYELAQTLTRLGRHQEAYGAYRAALETSPSLSGPIGIALARTCLELGKLDEAAANAALGARANAAQSHEILARVALARDDLATAESEALQATGDPLAESNAALLRAEVRLRRGDGAGALQMLDETARRAEERRAAPQRDLQFLRGDVLARLNRLPEADAAFEREIRAFPDNLAAYSHLAIVRGLEGKTVGEVRALFEAMARANPGPAAARTAAETLESMGDRAGAATWRRRQISQK